MFPSLTEFRKIAQKLIQLTSADKKETNECIDDELPECITSIDENNEGFLSLVEMLPELSRL